MSRLNTDIPHGLGWGAAFAGLYSVVALLIFLIQGQRPFDANGTSLPKVLLLYWAGGLMGGLLYGLLRPLGASRAGSALLGFLVLLPIAGAASLLVRQQ